MDLSSHCATDAADPTCDLLLAHGIKPTQQRVEIARFLFARPQHVAAEQVLQAVNSGDDKVSKATVYNTLNLFVRTGLVREVLVDPERVFYDSNTTAHHHLYNEDTGELTDLDRARVQIAGEPELPPGLEVVGAELVIRVRRRRT